MWVISNIYGTKQSTMLPPACCNNCPFEYDTIQCKFYNKDLWEDTTDEAVDTFTNKPSWCKITEIIVLEGVDK
jgi:hypothetical protein